MTRDMSAEAAGIGLLIAFNHHASRTECDAMTDTITVCGTTRDPTTRNANAIMHIIDWGQPLWKQLPLFAP